MGEIWQEMRCGECKSHFGFHLCKTTNGDVEVICGICKHRHARHIVDGRVVGDAKTQKYVCTIEVLRSACYPNSRTYAMIKQPDSRAGETGEPAELSREMTDAEKVRQDFINELWLDKFTQEVQ